MGHAVGSCQGFDLTSVYEPLSLGWFSLPKNASCIVTLRNSRWNPPILCYWKVIFLPETAIFPGAAGSDWLPHGKQHGASLHGRGLLRTTGCRPKDHCLGDDLSLSWYLQKGADLMMNFESPQHAHVSLIRDVISVNYLGAYIKIPDIYALLQWENLGKLWLFIRESRESIFPWWQIAFSVAEQRYSLEL